MKELIANPTWDQMDAGCQYIARQVRKMYWSGGLPDVIIGLARGGLVPAVRVSHILDDLPMVSVAYSSKRGRGDNRNHNNDLPILNNREHILIIDDIVDSGETMYEVEEFYRERRHTVVTAALYYKEGAAFKPDIHWQTTTEDSPWIIFPFEL